MMTTPAERVASTVPVRGPAMTPALSPRQRAIFELLATGIGRREVAVRLGYSVQTVRNDIQAAYETLGTDSVLETLYRLGWIVPAEAAS